MVVGIEEAHLLRLIKEVLLGLVAETGVDMVVQAGDNTGIRDGPRQWREWLVGH